MAAFGGDQEGKALEYLADGEKCLKKWSLFSSSTKHEDAAECFDKAARCFKVSGAMCTAPRAVLWCSSGRGGGRSNFFLWVNLSSSNVKPYNIVQAWCKLGWSIKSCAPCTPAQCHPRAVMPAGGIKLAAQEHRSFLRHRCAQLQFAWPCVRKRPCQVVGRKLFLVSFAVSTIMLLSNSSINSLCTVSSTTIPSYLQFRQDTCQDRCKTNQYYSIDRLYSSRWLLPTRGASYYFQGRHWLALCIELLQQQNTLSLPLSYQYNNRQTIQQQQQ